MKHSDFELYEWVKKVILSCKTPEQLESAIRLYLIFIEKLIREHSKNEYIIRNALSDLFANRRLQSIENE